MIRVQSKLHSHLSFESYGKELCGSGAKEGKLSQLLLQGVQQINTSQWIHSCLINKTPSNTNKKSKAARNARHEQVKKRKLEAPIPGQTKLHFE